ncbi:MAG: EthD domain-containing protein [Anaerolineales bacterium]
MPDTLRAIDLTAVAHTRSAYQAIRYVQSHTTDSPLNENIQKSRGLSEPYDGVGEIWWESEADFLSAINSPEGQNRVIVNSCVRRNQAAIRFSSTPLTKFTPLITSAKRSG